MSLPTNINDTLEALKNAAEFGAPMAGSGAVYLRMSQDGGTWSYGSEKTEVENGALWAVNPTSFEMGFTNFAKKGRQRNDEVLRPINQPPIQESDLRNIEGGEWHRTIGFQVKCINGEDKDLQGMIFVRSMGGFKAGNKLIDELIAQMQTGTDKIVPVIELKTESYENKKYSSGGRIYNPVFDVREWCVNEEEKISALGESYDNGTALEAPEEPKEEVLATAAPVKRRRRR